MSKIEDVLPNKKYIIRQENSTAEEVKLESEKNHLVSSPGLKTSPSQVARIPAITLFKGPTINLRKNGIEKQKNKNKAHQLINLWATWCAPCIQEMAHFRDHKKRLIDSEVEMIAVNVDELDPQNDNSKKPSDVIKKMNFPFPSISANKQLMEILQRIHDQSVGLNEPLPIPSSFLIDPNGDVSVIYKGPVNVEQIIKDLRLSSEGFITRVEAAAKLEGSLIKNPKATRRLLEHEASIHRRHAINWYSAGDLRGAINHFEKANKLVPDSKQLSSQLASVYFAFATQMDRQQMKETAINHYRKGLVIDPSNNAARNNLAWILATSANQDLRNAQEALIVATKLNADTGNKVPQVLDTLAAAQAANGQFMKAAKSAEMAISQLKNNSKLKQTIQNRLNLYKNGKAFLQSTNKK